MLWVVAGVVVAALIAAILVTVGGGDDANDSPIEAGTPVVMEDENHPVAGHFGLSAYPFRVFVSDSGTVIGRFDGSFDTESLKTVLEVVAEV